MVNYNNYMASYKQIYLYISYWEESINSFYITLVTLYHNNYSNNKGEVITHLPLLLVVWWCHLYDVTRSRSCDQ